MLNSANQIGRFSGIYRGYVIWNNDPLYKGRIKVFVPGVYPSQYESNQGLLPWAEPAMPPFGGGGPNENGGLNYEVGWSSVPHAGNIKTGSQVFVFFESGDINYPIYFAVSQSGMGWLAQHQNQHVFKSDNVRVRIQQNFGSSKTSCKFNSYTTQQSDVAKKSLKNTSEQKSYSYDNDCGQILELPTRIDIQIQATDNNAVNLNIHGNVNMHIDGDWITQHIGNRYQYHKGDTYIKNQGPIYIQHQGTIYKSLLGDISQIHTGNLKASRTGNTDITDNGTLTMTVTQDVLKNFNSNYKLNVGKNYTKIITENQNVTIGDNKSTTISRGNEILDIVLGYKQENIGLNYSVNVQENIDIYSRKGNIIVKTLGQFPLMNDKNAVTIEGFKNIGTKGNIHIVSTFGNINVECIQNSEFADFNTKSVIVPWNPSFYIKMKQYFPDLSITQVLSQGMSFPSSIIDFAGFLKFFKELPSLAVYDGLPVFLPTKMIIQNPDIQLPKNDLDYSWIPKFRSEDSDWRNISNTRYWKIPGKLMGNINISTWSGDINVSTDSKLGCAGNINITASEEGGTLPGYKIGTVNIDSHANKRIYPDPRDLFFDSNFEMRMGGQLSLFSHGTNYLQMIAGPRNSVLPMVANSILKSTGFSFNWYATNYDDFYQKYAKNVVLKGNIYDVLLLQSDFIRQQISKVKQNDAPILGCTKCISDYLLGIPGIQDLCYATQKLSSFGIDGIHEYGFSKFSPQYKDSPRGTFNIETLNFNKISIGDGHAIQTGFTSRQLTGPNMGAVNINTNGDLFTNVGRNYYMVTNAVLDQEKHTKIGYQYSQEYWDDVFPPILQTAMNLPNKIWNNTFGQIITIEDGNLVIGKSLGPLYETQFCQLEVDLPFPQNKLYVIGETNTVYKLTSGYNQVITNVKNVKIDYGFQLKDCLSYVMNPAKLAQIKLSVITTTGTTKLINDNLQIKDEQLKINTINADFAKTQLLFNQNQIYQDSSIGYNHGESQHGYQEFNLTWNPRLPLLFPKYYWKNSDIHNIIDGKGYKKSTDFESYKYHELINFNIFESLKTAKEQYTDYIVDEDVSVKNGSYADGQPRDIIITRNYDAGKSISQYITWTSPINTHTFVLNSDTYFEDAENEQYISLNNYQILLNGNLDKPGLFDKAAKYTQNKKNTFSVSNTYFRNNKINFSNTSHQNRSNNIISIFNGNEQNTQTSGSINQIIVQNGNNTEKSKNNIGIFNGMYTKASDNVFVLNNGDTDYTVSGQLIQTNELTINCGNGTNSYSMYSSFFIDKDDQNKLKQTGITNQYAQVEKHLNVGIYNLQNVGKLYTINTGQYVQNASLSAVTNSLKIDHNTGNVPSATIQNPIKPYQKLKMGESYKSYFKQLVDYTKNLFKLNN